MIARALGCVLLALLLPAAAQAQRAGAPPFLSVLHGPGYGISLQLTRGAVLPATGRTTAVGASLERRIGAVSLTAGGAWLDADDAASGWSADAGVSPELCAPLRAASIDGGFHLCNLLPEQFGLRARAAAGHSAVELPGADAAITEAALGLGISLRAPIPILTLEAWTEPRLHLRTANAAASRGLERTTRAGLGWTLGLAVTSTSGLGGSIAIDRVWIERPPETQFRARGVGIGLAVHYLR